MSPTAWWGCPFSCGKTSTATYSNCQHLGTAQLPSLSSVNKRKGKAPYSPFRRATGMWTWSYSTVCDLRLLLFYVVYPHTPWNVQTAFLTLCLFSKTPGEIHSHVFVIWEAEDKCFKWAFCSQFGITLKKVNWLGLPLSEFENPLFVHRIRYSCPILHAARVESIIQGQTILCGT